nr:hypothetical protein Ade03nite_54640 [Actinoplanes derwentensis]
MSRVAAVLAVLLFTGAVRAAPARAAAADYVLYYTVGSVNPAGQENLGNIADRLLGGAGRATDIFNLNSGRSQPAGGALSNPNSLTAGWYLVLPWDAVGSGVRYGVLPTTAPAPAAAPDTNTGATTAPGATTPGSAPGGGSTGGGQPATTGQAERPTGPGVPQASTPVNPGAVPSSPPPAAPPSGKCVAAIAASAPSNWAMRKLAADQVWEHSRGVGQLVAVVDSGVDGRAAQLSGRVAIGANIVTGDGRGDSDCLGTGTAMAGLVAAQPVNKETFTGVAPESVVMPVRVVTDGTAAGEAAQAAAIEVAVSAGATVIALGSYVDVTRPAVVQAVQAALDQDIVVVAGAPPAGPRDGAVEPPAEVIIVGGVGVDGKTAEEYAPQSVDVVAPGVNIASLGINGTKRFVGSGTEYAVALAAGAVALVRGSHPELKAPQIVHRVAITADRMGDAQPDSRYGYGMINPEAAVTRELPEETALLSQDNDPAGASTDGDGVRVAFLVTVLVGLILSALLVFRLRRTMRGAEAEGDLDAEWPAGPMRPEDEPTVVGSR